MRFGVGNDLACLCDIPIASLQTKFASSFIKMALISGGCGMRHDAPRDSLMEPL
jgi:enoyl-CoA hydratase/carnithine racemase